MVKSFEYHLQAVKLSFIHLTKWKFIQFLIPGTIITIAYYLFRAFLSTQQEILHIGETEIGWIDWISGWINSGTNAVFSIMDAVFLQLYIFIVLTVLSPFNAMLGEKLDTELTGKQFKFSLVRFLNDMLRMTFVVLLALLAEVAFLLVYWTLSWVIGGEILDMIVYFVIAAFFFGFSFYDFSLERYGQNVFDTFSYAFSNPLKTILTGSIFLAVYSIPYIGIPLAPVLAVMISTIVYLYDTKRLPRKQETEISTQEND